MKINSVVIYCSGKEITGTFIFAEKDITYDDGTHPYRFGPDFLLYVGLFIAWHHQSIENIEVRNE